MKPTAIKIVAFVACAMVGVAIYLMPIQPSASQKAETNVAANKVKEAIALVQFGGQPMQGIQLLREVISEDPYNAEALYYLGVFSVQSKQWDKGLGRFETLKEKVGYENYPDAYYYHALCLASTSQMESAKTMINEGLSIAQDSVLVETLSQFKNTIINL